MYDLAAFKRALDPVLAAAFDARRADFLARADDPDLAALLEHARAIVLADGKRVRPYMAYLMHATLAPDAEPPLSAFAALELFHAFALIHDDVIDEGTVRHGVPALHVFARTLVADTQPNAARVAEGQAILVGDLLHAWSRRMLADGSPDAALRAALLAFDEMADAVVAGQMLDVALMGAADATPPQIERKTLLKTAHYTFLYPLRIGARLAGEGNAHDAWIERFGCALGMAFQVQDDLLDVITDGDELGKRPLNDVREGQHTLLSAHLHAHATDADRRAFAAAFGNAQAGDAPDAAAEIRALYERSGAISVARERIAAELAAAEAALEDAPFPEDRRAPWRAFIERMRGRVR